jgi:CubicO group peptidase (beta-lactamase class C family)
MGTARGTGIGALLLLAAAADVAGADRVDEYVAAEMARQKIPGLSLAVVRDGALERARGYGLANLELGVAASERTIYQSGSLGKQFTAALVMLLVEEGRLALDDRIGRHLPGLPPAWAGITIRHLLTHTSGIEDYTETELVNYRLDYTDDELLRLVATLPLDFAPGVKWSYSNTGYLLLGLVVNRATGRFYGDLLRERVFAPLGMRTARVISEEEIVENRAAGYRLVDGTWKNQEYVSPTLNRQADGSLYLSVLDLVRWDAALAARKLLRPESYEAIWKPVELNDGTTHPYGFGWQLAPTNGHPTLSHSGAWQGFQAHIARFAADRLTVIVLANVDAADPERIAHGVAALYVPELAVKP